MIKKVSRPRLSSKSGGSPILPYIGKMKSLEYLITSTPDLYRWSFALLSGKVSWSKQALDKEYQQLLKDPALWNLKGYGFPSPPDCGPRSRSKSKVWTRLAHAWGERERKGNAGWGRYFLVPLIFTPVFLASSSPCFTSGFPLSRSLGCKALIWCILDFI